MYEVNLVPRGGKELPQYAKRERERERKIIGREKRKRWFGQRRAQVLWFLVYWIMRMMIITMMMKGTETWNTKCINGSALYLFLFFAVVFI